MKHGRTINIFLPEGDSQGIKICSIADAMVKATFIPRVHLKEVQQRKDLTDPGIYFLFGGDEIEGQQMVYVGEAENVLTRLNQHNREKDFWNTAVCFLSEKRNINKAHVKYLEGLCCIESHKNPRFVLKNTVAPRLPRLSESDEALANRFFDDLKIILASLGYPLFKRADLPSNPKDIFFCKSKNAYASGRYEEDGMLVMKGSLIRKDQSFGLGLTAHLIRLRMKEVGLFVDDNSGKLMLQEDYFFSSPSMAASVILGRQANGWIEWKDDKGKTLNERFRT